MARGYCAPLREAEVDTLILGCTHYPLVAPMLQRILGRNVRLVSGGHAVAAAVQRTLDGRRPRPGTRRARATTGSSAPAPVSSFGEVATRFLQMPLGEVGRSSSPSRRSSPRALRIGTEICTSARHPRELCLPGSSPCPTCPPDIPDILWRVAKVLISIPDDLLERVDEPAELERDPQRLPAATRRAKRSTASSARVAQGSSKTARGRPSLPPAAKHGGRADP